ncbi:kinase-like domain-containing protein [Sporodiniella umbellata]|nr:kinase-like domain-containing protein [Sporodiniella umbellata]
MGALCCKEEPVDLSTEVSLCHFTLLKSVGRGAFGKVRVVRHKGTGQLYALKYISKEKCLETKTSQNILSERQLLKHLDHPLIVNLRYSFQDSQNLFMVLDLMLGGDLRFRLEKSCLPEDHVRFYAAQIALALDYLHTHNIIHRDIKPDNILLDQKGHAHLTDFNVAARLSSEKQLTSVAGSLAYIAPEMLRKSGYGFPIDWWSLGICLYELLYGKRPFTAKATEALKQAILQETVIFPKEPNVSSEAIDLLRGLLERQVDCRFTFQQLKSHPWFKTMDWDLLTLKTVQPPFIPDENKFNFDPTHEIEEVLLDGYSTPCKRRVGPKSSSLDESLALEKKREYLEKHFLTFDYTKQEPFL